jgi:hypothetical protein
LELTRKDHTAAELRSIAGKCRDGAQVRRLLALALVLDGRARSGAEWDGLADPAGLGSYADARAFPIGPESGRGFRRRA